MRITICCLLIFCLPALSQAVRPHDDCGAQWSWTNLNYPWLLSLQAFNDGTGLWDHFCSGVLINTGAFITSAKCALYLRSHNTRIEGGCGDLLGERGCHWWGGQRVEVIAHPGADGTKRFDPNDIAVVKPELSFSGPNFYERKEKEFNNICLPEPEKAYPPTRTIVHAFGWKYAVTQITPEARKSYYGLGLSKDIKKNDLQVKDKSECPTVEDGWEFVWKPSPHFEKICESCKIFCLQTREQGAAVCAGDEGGPVVQFFNDRYHVMGIITRARPCDVTSDKPATYLQLAPFIPWIRSVVPDLQLE